MLADQTLLTKTKKKSCTRLPIAKFPGSARGRRGNPGGPSSWFVEFVDGNVFVRSIYRSEELEQSTRPEGARPTIDDKNSNVASVTDGRGNTVNYEYDALNRLTKMIDALSQETTYFYESTNQVSLEQQPEGVSRRSIYDERGLLVFEENSRGSSWSYGYDAAGRMVRQLDANGVEKTLGYTPTNLLETITARVNEQVVGTRSFVYDEVGQLKSASDGGVATSLNTVGAGGGYHSDTYGLVHRQTETVDGTSVTTNYAYDAYQRLTSVRPTIGASVGTQVAYQYDAMNRLSGMPGFVATGGIAYDSAGRLSSILSANGVATSFAYDKNSRLTGLSYADGGTELDSVTLAYDGANNVIRKNANDYIYDARNMLKEAQLDDRFARDIELSQTTGIVNRDVAGEKAIEFAPMVEEFALDFDANSIGISFSGVREVYGLLVSSANAQSLDIQSLEVYLSDSNQPGSWTEYRDFVKEDLPDGSIRLRFRTPQATRFVKLHSIIDNRSLLNLAIGTPQVTGDKDVLVKAYYYVRNRTETYNYSNRGDRTSYSYSQDDQEPEAGSYTYYPNSELLKTDGTYGYVYGGNGNLVAKGTSYVDHGNSVSIYDEGIAWTYEWDAFSRLSTVKAWDEDLGGYETVASYAYNYKGERVQRTGNDGVTRYAYDQAGQLVMTKYPDGSAEQLVWMGNRLFARELIAPDGTKSRSYYGTDHLGTTILLTDEDGQIVSQGDTTPFGLDAGVSGFESMAVRYTGKDLDPDTGLYYFNARWMDPATGRFLSEDPIRDGRLWYGYVGNNPLSFVDPTGFYVEDFYNRMMTASAEEREILARVQDSTTWTDKGGGVYEVHRGATLAELGKLTGLNYEESSFYDFDRERRAESLQIGEIVSFPQVLSTFANMMEGIEPSNTPPRLPEVQIQLNWEKYAGVDLIGLGTILANAGRIAATGAATSGIATTGVTAVGVVSGGGMIALGVGIVAIGIDLIEGQGLDKTMEFFTWLIGAY